MQTRDKNEQFSPFRYGGIDSFRVVGIYVVILAHFHLEFDKLVPHASLNLLVRFLDCAFPFVILASFFLLALSVLNNAERDFKSFFKARFKRIWMPFFIWTIIYRGIMDVLLPLKSGGTITAYPPATLIISGYMHLWFLQFIFLGSIVLYPLLRFIARKKQHKHLFALICFAVPFLYIILIRPFVENLLNSVWMAQADLSFKIFAGQVNNYIFYIPPAIGISLYADWINSLYRHSAFRLIVLLVVIASMTIHLMTDSLRFTKGFYSLAVFIGLLQPPPAMLVNFLRPIARYTYPIYILHFFPVGIVARIFYQADIKLTAANYLCLIGSGVIFVFSFLISMVIRKIFPRDWLLPLIPISRQKQK